MLSKLAGVVLLLISINVDAQYQRIHRKAVLIDTHNDVLSGVIMKGLHIEDDLSGKTHTDLKRLSDGGVDVQVFSVFCDERYGNGTAFRYANSQIDSLYAIINRHPETLQLVTNPEELKEAVKNKKTGCMMGVEGGHMIENRLDYLDSLYRRGVRYMTLTWNNSTSWATSAADETAKKDSLPHLGLTDFGKQIVQRINELGMLVDVSHVGEHTFWDAINTTKLPVIASHSNAYTLCPVPRNLRDDQIRAIGKNGGVIHLNFYSGFIDSNYNKNKNKFLSGHQAEADSLRTAGFSSYEREEWLSRKYHSEAEALRPPLSKLLDHLDYIVKLIGVDHVGLGSDFDGIESAPAGLDDVSCFPLITKSLMERGYSKKDIKKILGGNFIRVFRQVQSSKTAHA
jgi:membrane dipeptidase